MKKSWFTIFITVFGAVIFLGCKENTNSPQRGGGIASEPYKNSYFFDLPITSWTSMMYPSPCITLQVGDLTVSALIDLGFSGHFSFDESVLSQMSDKVSLEPRIMYAFNGKKFEEKVFQIPSILMSKIKVNKPIVQQEVLDFHKNSRAFIKSQEFFSEQTGTVGWEAFEYWNIMFDTNNEKIIICDSFERLKEVGYKIDRFTKTPLFLDRGFVEIETKTPSGVKRCMLDTGSTTNVLNDPSLIGRTNLKSDNGRIFPDFYISDMNFGPVDFVHLPLEMPIQVDTILGMEFFSKNVVFLDFMNGMAYFSPSVKEETI